MTPLNSRIVGNTRHVKGGIMDSDRRKDDWTRLFLAAGVFAQTKCESGALPNRVISENSNSLKTQAAYSGM